MRDQKRARRHILKSKRAKHTTFGSLLEVETLKRRMPLCRQEQFQVKAVKTYQPRSIFGSLDVEKVRAVVARSTVSNQNGKSTPPSHHLFSWQATTTTTTRLHCTALFDTYSCSYRVQLQLHHATTPHKYNYNNNRTARQDYNTGTLRRYALQHYNITTLQHHKYNTTTLQLHNTTTTLQQVHYTTPHYTTPTTATTTTLRYTRL